MRLRFLMAGALIVAVAGLILLFVDFRAPENPDTQRGSGNSSAATPETPGSDSDALALPDAGEPAAEDDVTTNAGQGQGHDHGAELPPLPGGDIPSPDAIIEASNRERAPMEVQPRWRTGDVWVVETYVRQIQTPEGNWSRVPRRYRYEVADETRFNDREVFQLKITMLAAEDDTRVEDFPEETFYVDRKSYALVGLERTSREGGKDVLREHSFDHPSDQGSSSQFTSVPYDMPPRGLFGEVAPYDDAFTALKFSEPGAPRVPEAELVGAGGNIIEVHFNRSSDGGAVHQRWSLADPRWPVETVTANTRSYLRR